MYIFIFQSVLKILTAGEDKGAGTLVVHGPQDLVAQVGPKYVQLIIFLCCGLQEVCYLQSFL